MPVCAQVVDLESLWQTVVGAIVAATVVVTCFSLSVLGSARSSEDRNNGQSARAAAWVAVGIVGLLGTAIAIAPGMIVVVDK